jgi:DNA-binding response OmpR family regulator
MQGWNGKTILVVDDNRNVRRVLRYQFQKRGYTVLEAPGGREAIDLTKTAHIDLITLDLMMPTISGYDVLKMIRENPATRDIPILIISVVEDRERGLLLGANDCLGKPFVEEDLIRKVQNLMGSEKKSILVVDDEASVLEILRMRLSEMGFPVEVASDGEAAIESMKHRVPDLLILDVLLPGKTGYEVLNWVRNETNTAKLPVIMISACPLSDQHVKLLNLGADAFVEKSESLGSLFERIDAMVMSAHRGSCLKGSVPGEPVC